MAHERHFRKVAGREAHPFSPVAHRALGIEAEAVGHLVCCRVDAWSTASELHGPIVAQMTDGVGHPAGVLVGKF